MYGCKNCKTREISNFWKNDNIVILVKNSKFIFYISDDETDFTVRIVLQNLVNTSNSETVEICTFFKASRFGCRKTTFDVRKVTYNMYTCYTCFVSREMMKMDDRDNAKC